MTHTTESMSTESMVTQAEQAVMVCPQCEGEGGYPDGLDEAACYTECTRCAGNGWIVDLARHRTEREAVLEGWLVERLSGEGYGKARMVLDARQYDAGKPAFFVNEEARGRHRVTPLFAALTTPAPAVSTDEIVAVLERCRDREHNPFEPDNQTTLHGDLCAILSRLRGEGGKPDWWTDPTDTALLADIFAKMEEVLKPLPVELPNALGAAGTRATESGEGDEG